MKAFAISFLSLLTVTISANVLEHQELIRSKLQEKGMNASKIVLAKNIRGRLAKLADNGAQRILNDSSSEYFYYKMDAEIEGFGNLFCERVVINVDLSSGTPIVREFSNCDF